MSLYEDLRLALPAELPAYLLRQRWFGGKARQIRAVDLLDLVPLQTGQVDAYVLLAQVEYETGPLDTYVLPMVLSESAAAPHAGDAAALHVRGGGNPDGGLALTDAFGDERFLSWLLDAVEVKLVSSGVAGEIRASYTEIFQEIRSRAGDDLRPQMLRGEQSNTSIAYGDRLIFKIFRRVEEGVNTDLEIGLFLTETAHFPNVPPIAGALEYRGEGGRVMSVGILQRFVSNQGDAWKFTLEALKGFWEEAAKRLDGPPNLSAEAANPALAYDSDAAIPSTADELIGPYLAQVELLGRRTAELHVALASDSSKPAFAPEPFAGSFLQDLQRSAIELTERNLGLLREKLDRLPVESRADAEKILASEAEIVEKLRALAGAENLGARTRIHGDYHLGQVLYTGSDFMIIDFEGEPARPLAERRLKRSALQDVAGMVRSFHYAAFSHLLNAGNDSQPESPDSQKSFQWAQAWYAAVASRFLKAYFETAQAGAFLPPSREEASALLQFHLLEKAVYELGYELNNRPAWVGIPMSGILQLLPH